MDLIYMNEDKDDLGVLKDFSFDLAIGGDENDFECRIPLKNNCCKGGYFLYIEGTEYGGIIDHVKVDTQNEQIIYSGRTWQGILESKIFIPDTVGSDISIVGEANGIMNQLILNLRLEELFKVSEKNSEINIPTTMISAYARGYSEIQKILHDFQLKLKLQFINGYVEMEVVRAVDYSTDEQFDSSQITFTVEKKYNSVNHLLCLWKQEGSQDQVLHLYCDMNGNISQMQSLFGKNEVINYYEDSSAKSLDEFEEAGIAKIKESREGDNLEIAFSSDDEGYDIGDLVGALENFTKISMKARISKKIVKIQNGTTSISYEIGDHD